MAPLIGREGPGSHCLKGHYLPAAEATLPPGELIERVAEIGVAEIRPECLGEDELGIRGLPQEEVREALLPRRSDDEIGVRQLGCGEACSKGAVVDVVRVHTVRDQSARGL